MSLWTSLVQTALLGTDRGSLPVITAVSPLTTLLHQLKADDPEAALLNMAGLIDLHEQAGQIPARISLPPTTIVAGEKPEPPPAVSHRLGTLLSGQYSHLLPEFLQALAQAGYRVPTMHLPNLLEKGAKMISLRPFLLPVLDQPGRWLAHQNPTWAYALLNEAPWQQITRQWQQTPSTKRYALLRQLRYIQPEKALQMLESTWRSENDIVRGQLIKLLHINISMADEPFLERALDDRSRLVRSKAAELLTHLPESRLSKRMLQYTRNLLLWTPRGPIPFKVSFPTFTKAMMRDGIFHQENIDRNRLRARQLIQMITAIPLDHWTRKWDVTPEEILNQLPDTRWPNTLSTAFTTATKRQKNARWAAAILNKNGIRDRTAKLVSILPDNVLMALIDKMTKQINSQPSISKGSPTRLILTQWNHPWPIEPGRLWLNVFAAVMSQENNEKRVDPTLSVITRKFAKLCPPALADEAAHLLSPDKVGKDWQTTAQNIVNTLAFRQAMIQEIETSK